MRMMLNWHDEPHLRIADRPDYMQDDKWLYGFSLLEKHGLSFDLQIFDHQIPEAVRLAQAFPNTQIILEHLAWPSAIGEDDFVHWKDYIEQIAACNNVTIKLSCIALIFQKRLEEVRICEYLRHAIQEFGVDRCMFASNFPPDGLFYDYAELVNLIKKAVAEYSYAEQKKIFSLNADRIYQISRSR